MLFSQTEALVPFNFNYSLNEAPSSHFNTGKILAVDDTLSLPFKDDFSKAGPFPDSKKWINSNSVYVNTDFPANARTLGVATFDGLNKKGVPYFPMNTIGSFKSDTLTSKPLYLKAPLSPADSLYLSFYFESTGLSQDAPESGDILIVEFYDVDNKMWVTKKNISRPNNASWYDNRFQRVMLPINESIWFKNGFQFRFRNLSTACGSVDLWHIDEVVLDKNRSFKDTLSKEVCFAYLPGTLLKHYTAMPFKQYLGPINMGSSTPLLIRNNDTAQVGINITGNMQVINRKNNQVIFSQNNGSGEIYPYYPNGYSAGLNITNIATPNYSTFSYNSGSPFTDTASFLIKHFISTNDNNHYNDTVTRKQCFYNYYAYDDGTAEAGYYLNTYGAELAIRFDINVKDTLRALDICFDPIVNTNQISNLNFDIQIWENDNNGLPGGTLIDGGKSFNPKYSKIIGYPFVRYMLKNSVVLNPGTYFIGIKQYDAQALNIGFDRNTNVQSFNFYNSSGSWQNSSFQGSIMLRPVTGDSIKAINGVKYVLQPQGSNVTAFPNPANDKVTISMISDYKDLPLQIEWYDLLGNLIRSTVIQNGENMSTENLENGIYLLKINQNKQFITTKKIIVQH